MPIQAQQDADAAKRLQRLTGPFILRRLKTDKSIISDLPDKLEMKVYCNLTKEQASLYEAVVKDMLDGLKAKDGIDARDSCWQRCPSSSRCATIQPIFSATTPRFPAAPASWPADRDAGRSLRRRGAGPVFTQFSELGEILRRHLPETLAGKCSSSTAA